MNDFTQNLSSRTSYIGYNTGLRVHGIVFTSVNGFLFLLNLLIDYSYPWHLWILMSWGVGFAIHASVVWAKNHKKYRMDRAIIIHGAIVAIVSLYFLWIDLFTSLRLSWFYFIAFPLIAAWLNHYIVYRSRRPQVAHFSETDIRVQEQYTESRYIKKVKDEINQLNSIDNTKILNEQILRVRARRLVGLRISLQIHTLWYSMIMIFLAIINILETPHYFWVFWPAMAWGIFLASHFISAAIARRRLYGYPVEQWLILCYPGTVSLFLIFVDLYSTGSLNWFWWAVVPIMGVAWFIVALVFHVKKVHEWKRAQMKHKIEPSIEVNKTPEISTDRKFCPSCGGPIKENYEFCEFCGFHLNKHK